MQAESNYKYLDTRVKEAVKLRSALEKEKKNLAERKTSEDPYALAVEVQRAKKNIVVAMDSIKPVIVKE